MEDKKFPNIPIKVTREGDKLKLVAGRFKLVLSPIEGKSQTYPLLALDSFITSVTTKLLQEEIDKQERAKEFRKSFTQASEEVTDKHIVDLLMKESGEAE